MVLRTTTTCAFNQAANAQRSERASGTSDFQDWFSGWRSIEISEDVCALGRSGKTLTVLYDMKLPDEAAEADDESLVESRAPRFRH